MRTHFRRTGIAVLVTALVTSLLSTTQAGVIPWLYDAIFGPVHPQYYSGWSGYGCAPARCAPCNTCRMGVAPRSTSRCATGSCSTTAFYGPCGTTCSTTVACADSSNAEVGKLAPEPDDVPPAAKTFDDAPVPDPARLDLDHAKPTVSGVAAPEGTTGAEDAGFGAGTGGDATDGEFSPPVIRTEEKEAEEAAPGEPGSPAPTLNLDNETSWKAPIIKRRIGMRATFRNARIARHTRPIDRDYVIPVSSTARIAGR